MIIFLFSTMFFSIYMLYRIDIVYGEKLRLLKEIGKLANLDIAARRECGWRFDEFEKLSMSKMLWQLFTFHWDLPMSCYTESELREKIELAGDKNE